MTKQEVEELADRLLERMRRRPGRFTAVASLTKAMKATAEEVDNSLRFLKALGYKVRQKKGLIAFISAPDTLISTEIAYGLKTKMIGRRIYAYRSVRSTNDIAAELAQAGEPEGTIVTAEQQTKGRGRLGRSWHSPPGCGIYVSTILKPKFAPGKAPGLAIMTSVALADAVSKFCQAQVNIKWPNDILINGKKAAGILTELSAEKDKIDYVIVGVGVNVNHRADDFPAELRASATSLRLANRRKVKRVALFHQFLRNLESEYRRYCKSQLSASHAKIRRYSSLIGHPVRLSIGRKIEGGVVIDIDAAGALILEQDGQRRAVTSGEVTLVKE